MTAYPGQTRTRTTLGTTGPMGLPITAGYDTAWNQTRDCSDAASTEMHCRRPLRQSGASHCSMRQRETQFGIVVVRD